MTKKYYWLKLKTDFFTSKEIKKLRRTAGGDTFVIIYLKMQLLSLQNNGRIYYDGIEEDFASEIALTLDEDPDNVRLTMAFLQNCGLIECNEINECFLTQVPEVTGKECDSAQRVRDHRAKKALQCNNEVTRCNTEIEKDIETDKDTEKENKSSGKPDCPSSSNPKKSKVPKNPEAYEKIISYLNEKTGARFQADAKETIKLIDARLKEKYTIDDFLTVIDKKCIDWLDSEKMSGNLKPSTLFSSKHFEEYLNQVIKPRKQTGQNGIEIDQSPDDNNWDDIFNLEFGG